MIFLLLLLADHDQMQSLDARQLQTPAEADVLGAAASALPAPHPDLAAAEARAGGGLRGRGPQ